jgi:hypothetical protein
MVTPTSVDAAAIVPVCFRNVRREVLCAGPAPFDVNTFAPFLVGHCEWGGSSFAVSGGWR